MKIDNFVRIIDGALQTTPSIDAFEQIIFQSSKVSRGDLFIDIHTSHEAISEAIEKGAYTILSKLDFKNTDEEIAWIKVESISQSLIKLLRYLTTQKSLLIIIANPIQASFLKRVKVLPNDVVYIAQEVCKAKEDEILCLNDASLATLICPTAYTITNPLHVKITPKGFFLSSFSYEEDFFQEVKIPSLFVPDFLGALAFCKTHQIPYAIDSLNFIEHFYPQFITNNIRKKEFGMSEQVLIFEEDITLLEREIAYLKNQNLLLCLPKRNENAPFPNTQTFYYESSEDFEKLIQMDFRYALVLGKKEEFEAFLTRDLSTQLTLF